MLKYKFNILDNEWDIIFVKDANKKTKKRWDKGFYAYGETDVTYKKIEIYTDPIKKDKKCTTLLDTFVHEVGHAWEYEIPSHSNHHHNNLSADAMEYCVKNIDRFKNLIKLYKKDVKKVK